MDGGEPPPANDPAQLIFLDAGRTEDVEALALAAPGGLVAAGGLATAPAAGGRAATPTGGLDAAANGQQLSPGALGLAAEGAERLANAGQGGDGQVLPIDAVAHARSLLPTVCHPAIEYNLPVLEVERYKIDALDLLFHTSSRSYQ